LLLLVIFILVEAQVLHDLKELWHDDITLNLLFREHSHEEGDFLLRQIIDTQHLDALE